MINILIPTDFSDSAQNAIKYALKYFSNSAANFYLLHVSNQNKKILESQFAEDIAVETNSKNQLEEKVQILERIKTNVEHHFYAIEESISILEAVRKNVALKRVNYVVLGTKMQHKNQSNKLGSTSTEIITKVKCTMLVVPNHLVFRNISNLAFPTDYTIRFKNKFLKTISETMKSQNAFLRVFEITFSQHLNVHQSENKTFLSDFLKEMNSSNHAVANNLITTSIHNLIELLQIDMIALSAKNLNIIQQLLFNPLDVSPFQPLKIPFLIIHE